MQFIAKAIAAVLALGFSANATQVQRKANAIEAREVDWSSGTLRALAKYKSACTDAKPTASTVTVTMTLFPQWCSTSAIVPATSNPASAGSIPAASSFSKSGPVVPTPTGTYPAISTSGSASSPSNPVPVPETSTASSSPASSGPSASNAATTPASVPTSAGGPTASPGTAAPTTSPVGNTSSLGTESASASTSASTPTASAPSQSPSHAGSAAPGSSGSMNQVTFSLAFGGFLAYALFTMA
ncbi:MAG: hypothetical protein Q9165_002362 [Trypethelium subeluteriae]